MEEEKQINFLPPEERAEHEQVDTVKNLEMIEPETDALRKEKSWKDRFSFLRSKKQDTARVKKLVVKQALVPLKKENPGQEAPSIPVAKLDLNQSQKPEVDEKKLESEPKDVSKTSFKEIFGDDPGVPKKSSEEKSADKPVEVKKENGNPFFRKKNTVNEEDIKEKKYKSIGVNLIPQSEQIADIFRSKIKSLSIIVVLAVLMVIFVNRGLLFWNNSHKVQPVSVDEQLNSINQQILDLRTSQEEFSIVRDRLEGVEELLKKHTVWTEVLRLIEDITLQNVYYEKFSADLDAKVKVNLSAEAKDLTTVARQWAYFQKVEQIEDIVVGSLSLGGKDNSSGGDEFESGDQNNDSDERVGFNVEFTVSSNIFTQSENVSE